MKLSYTVLTVSIVLLGLGCKCKKDVAKNSNTTVNSKNAIGIQIKLTSTYSNCGGMRPTPEMEKNARTPHPLPTVVYLKKGTSNELGTPIFKTLNSNSEGVIDIKLEPGDYFIVREDKKDKETFKTYVSERKASTDNYKGFTEECYLKYYKTPDLAFTVSDTSTQFSRNFHRGCFKKPCENYVGPYPP